MATSKIVQMPGVVSTQPKRKPRNMRADGLKRVRLDLGVDPNTGKRLRKDFYGRTLKEAEAKKQAYKLELEAGPPKREYTVADWVEEWQAAYGHTGGYSNQANINNACQKIIVAMGTKLITEVRPVDVQKFATSNAHYSKSTVHKIKLVTRQVFDQALENDIIEVVPHKKVKWESVGEGSHRYLEEWEIRHITEHWREHRTGLWAILMLFAGLRRSEALALTWDDVDLTAGLIHVRHGLHFEGNKPVLGEPKTPYSIRDVPIFPPLSAALESIPLPQPSQYICTTADYHLVTETAFSSGWRAYLNTMANILNSDTKQPITPGRRSDKDKPDRRSFPVRTHDLRHSFCSMLYDAGVDVKTAQKLMGHSTPEITMRIYTHLSEMKKAYSVSKMEQFTAKFTTPILPPYTEK